MVTVEKMMQFMGASQRRAIYEGLKGEERDFFVEKLREIAHTFDTMPKTYEQDGLGMMEAIAHLHYFKGGMDWWITERDSDQDGEGQIQAFGLADLGYGGELGYISIAELIQNGVELDLYFTPCKLSELKQAACV